MQGGSPPIVCPFRQKIAEVNEQGAGFGDDSVPCAVWRKDLQAGDAVGVEHRHDALVGMGTHALLTIDRIRGPGLADVIVYPHRHR